MPVEEGLGLDQEHRPAGSRELAAQRCQQGAILGMQPGPWILATQDREFVTQDQDLDFLGLADRQQSMTSLRMRPNAR
jgi:hypothetical protein